MTTHPLSEAIHAIGVLVGGVAFALAVVAYLRFHHTNYRRILMPLIAATALFSIAHGYMVLWPGLPPVVKVLQPVAFTILAFGVVRLVRLHSHVTDSARSKDR